MRDFCDLLHQLRAYFFFKDRDVVLQTSRVFEGLGVVPIGGIILWYGSIASIPTGWQLCNGTNGTPDLRDQFVVGAGTTYSVGDTGGSATVDLRHQHTDGTYDTDDDNHRHGVGTLTMGGPSATNNPLVQPGTGDARGDHIHTLSGDTSWDLHDHDVTGHSASGLSTTTENRPPYHALAYIQRMS